MKKVLLFSIASIAMLIGTSQTTTTFPCVRYYSTGNLGGGDCETKGTGNDKHYPGYLTELENANYFPTGKITVFFESPIPAGIAAPVITKAGIDDGYGNILLPGFDYKYAAHNDNTSVPRSSVVYCYYGSAANQNIFNGAKAPFLAFEISYTVNSSSQTCGGVTLPSTLPVSFKSFTAVRGNTQTVALKWETAFEQNNRGFYVQRNMNGEWKDIAFVFSRAEGGNSSEILSYSYNDLNNLRTATYYRILQVDLDGKGRFSETRIVRGEEQQDKLMLFPNPGTNGKINVLFGDETSAKDVTVYDANGRVVKSYRNVLSNSLTIDNLKAGIYNVQVKNNSTQAISSDKFIIKE